MKIKLILEFLFGFSLLFLYIAIEKRINQRRCPACGNRASVDDPGEACTRCGALLK
ncbi:MAG TPA: hypothetical protein VNH22_00215 [Blastocatellia bacterium]|jgi:rRNA maturation endonuclease Nob1|nr:hypothetical protein [Blastocatellia bacterium]